MRPSHPTRLLRTLRAMRRSLPSRDQGLLRLGAAKKEAGRAFGFVKIHVPDSDQPVTRETFHVQVDTSTLNAAELRDGQYLLRSNLTADDPAVLWMRYVQLTQIEAAFRSLKKRAGYPSHRPPPEEPRRRPHLHRVSGLRPTGHAEEPVADSRVRPDASGHS